MDSLIGIIGMAVTFLVFCGLLIFIFKKNIFPSQDSKEIIEEEKLLSKQSNRLSELKKENESLNKEINFLEEKNKKLKYKIEQLKKIISHLEEQKNQLEKNEINLKILRERKDETLAMVAHDIKNPASAIKNFVELLESYDLSAQEQNDILSGLVEISSRIIKLADEFSQTVAEEYSTMQINKTSVNFYQIIESVIKINRVKANKKNLEIRLYQPKEELLINVDESKIKEVVDNYVGNAIKYCPENCKIEVVTNLEKNYVTVEVKDNGFGLTEDELLHVFEKGTKFGNKPTGDETSSGLGLWIVKKIVEEHNGKVWVKSKKGFGSTFAFKIPIEQN
ncbi:MAG: HAMP domain-containing histidine kinase [Ignavibacteriales bacterium]|nr:HAMP domain-containing histidine kinase [Ignavibacteriales bacterium]